MLSLQGSDTKAAQAALVASLRATPQDVDSRLQLFRFAVIDCNWERAANQLDVAIQLDASLMHTAMVYRGNIACERAREQVFSKGEMPVFLGAPPAWAGYLVQALRQPGSEAGAALAAQAFALADAIAGTINGDTFAWLADADSRFGPVLEAFIDGQYYWVPFERIERIAISAPVDALDLAWCPCELTLASGGVCHGFIPTRYPGTDGAVRDELKLARLTEWQPWSTDLQTGIGQRMFVSDHDEYALLDCRDIVFATAPPGLPS